MRAACKNAVLLAVSQSGRKVTARHTKNADFVVSDGMEVAKQWAESSRRTRMIAERMIGIKVQNNDIVVKAARAIFARGAGAKSRKHLDGTVETIANLYSNHRNSANYGRNGWSLYNAVTEYLDHERESDPKDRAETTMDLTSWVNKKKLATARHVLALSGEGYVG